MTGKRLLVNVVGYCECGYDQKFDMDPKAFTDSSATPLMKLNPIFTCPECKTKYDSILLEAWSKKNKTMSNVLGAILIVSLVFGGYKTVGFIFDSDGGNKKPNYYDTHDPNDMTNKDMEQFIEWKLKDNKKNRDSSLFNE